jgi:hypothetical protein
VNRTKISSIWLDDDVLDWLWKTGQTFGDNRSEKIRAVMRAGYSKLKKEYLDTFGDPIKTDPPDYDIEYLITHEIQLGVAMESLKERHDNQVDRITKLLKRIAELSTRIRKLAYDNHDRTTEV